MGADVNFIDSGLAVADEVAELLEELGLARTSGDSPSQEFYVTDSAARFRRVAELFLGRPLESVETVELGTV
jgi:glutamate racemase